MSNLPFEVNLDSEHIQQAIINAVIDSALGDKIKEKVARVFEKDKSYYSKSPIDEAIYSEVTVAVRTVIREEYAEAIKERVREKLTDERIDELAEELVKQVQVR